jgi:hypothetical protein
VPVDDLVPDRVEVREEMERVEDRVCAAARPRRRAHSVEHEPVRELLLAGVEHQLVRVQPGGANAAAIELGKERLEPERVLVQDPNRRVAHPAEVTDACRG